MYGLLALAVLGALGGIYGAGYRSGSNSVMNEWQTASREQREREEKKAQKAAEKKETGDAKAKVVYRTITKTVDRIVSEPSYRKECLTDDGLAAARQAIKGELDPPSKSGK
jgi:acetyl-CoA acetyltransferase